MPKKYYSQNVVSQAIQQLDEGRKFQTAEIYKHLREMVESGIIEQEGVEVSEQDTKQGEYGKVYAFTDCQKTVEIWKSLYGYGDVKSLDLLVEIRNIVDRNKMLRNYFPNWLYRKLLKHIADNSSK